LEALEALKRIDEARQVASSDHIGCNTTAIDGTSTPEGDLSPDAKTLIVKEGQVIMWAE
jgi:hypothetical protein